MFDDSLDRIVSQKDAITKQIETSVEQREKNAPLMQLKMDRLVSIKGFLESERAYKNKITGGETRVSTSPMRDENDEEIGGSRRKLSKDE